MPNIRQFSHSAMSDSLWSHGLHPARLPGPSTTPGAYSNSCPLSQWCHPNISSSVAPFFSCPQSFPAPESFPVSRLFVSGSQSIGASGLASILSVNIQGWFPLWLTLLISLQSKTLKSLLQHHNSKTYLAITANLYLLNINFMLILNNFSTKYWQD